MAATDIFADYMISKGPLSDEEVVLKELIMRDTYYAKSGKAATGVAAAQAQGKQSSAMVIEEFLDEEKAAHLRHVVPGELITADYVNGIVDAVNALSAELGALIKALKKRDIKEAGRSKADAGEAKSVAAAVVNEVKDVEVAFANQDDQKAIIRIPANDARKEDIADLLIDKVRIDPDEIKLVDGKFEITVDKAAISEKPRVRVVSNEGESAQNVLSLFK